MELGRVVCLLTLEFQQLSRVDGLGVTEERGKSSSRISPLQVADPALVIALLGQLWLVTQFTSPGPRSPLSTSPPTRPPPDLRHHPGLTACALFHRCVRAGQLRGPARLFQALATASRSPVRRVGGSGGCGQAAPAAGDAVQRSPSGARAAGAAEHECHRFRSFTALRALRADRTWQCGGCRAGQHAADERPKLSPVLTRFREPGSASCMRSG